MTHAEMIEWNERQKREHAEAVARFEAQGARYRAIQAGLDQALAQYIAVLNAPWEQFAAELRRENN